MQPGIDRKAKRQDRNHSEHEAHRIRCTTCHRRSSPPSLFAFVDKVREPLRRKPSTLLEPASLRQNLIVYKERQAHHIQRDNQELKNLFEVSRPTFLDNTRMSEFVHFDRWAYRSSPPATSGAQFRKHADLW